MFLHKIYNDSFDLLKVSSFKGIRISIKLGNNCHKNQEIITKSSYKKPFNKTVPTGNSYIIKIILKIITLTKLYQ